MAAAQSSAMMPQPPGSDSACRAGNGFQISNTRKSIKPRSKYFQLSGAERKKKREMLAGDFVDHHELRILRCRSISRHDSNPDTDKRDNRRRKAANLRETNKRRGLRGPSAAVREVPVLRTLRSRREFGANPPQQPVQQRRRRASPTCRALSGGSRGRPPWRKRGRGAVFAEARREQRQFSYSSRCGAS